MRIKRQRKKLRGRYSGNCLSCNAKWSKCWYIASVENQRDWESRLNKTVTPCNDEVCFQCWDAKIRTSPKRKIHFKTELPDVLTVDEMNLINGSRPSKRVERNKRRALNSDFDYNMGSPSKHSPSPSPPAEPSPPRRKKSATFEFEDDEEEHAQMYYDEEDGFEGVLFEEDAVILLSTAFKTIPFDVDVNINININNRISCLPEIAKKIINEEAEMFEDLKAKKRGADISVGNVGSLRKGTFATQLMTQSQSLSLPLPLPIPLPLQNEKLPC